MAGMMSGRIHRFAICAGALLAACSRGGAEDPAVVLERAASTAMQLRSAAFVANVEYDMPDDGVHANVAADGVLAEGGRQLSFAFDLSLTMPGPQGPAQTVTAEGDVVVADEREAYLRIARADGSTLFLPGIGLIPADMLDRWFRLGDGEAADAAGVTPDPSFVAMQAQVIRVTRDRSYATVDGERCYVYDVTIDAAKALAFLERAASEAGRPFDRAEAETFLRSYVAEGTVWIDEDTSVIRRIDWSFESAPGADIATGSFSLRLSDHDEPVEIAPPMDAVPLETALPNGEILAL